MGLPPSGYLRKLIISCTLGQTTKGGAAGSPTTVTTVGVVTRAERPAYCHGSCCNSTGITSLHENSSCYASDVRVRRGSASLKRMDDSGDDGGHGERGPPRLHKSSARKRTPAGLRKNCSGLTKESCALNAS